MPYRATPADGLAWITGASSGIGRAVALELARRGYQVAATARRVDELDVLAKADAKIHAFPGDVTDRNQMAALVPEIEARFGPIALAFLNAGLYLPAERRSFSPEIIAQTFDVNIGGTVNCLAPVLDAMRKRRKGHIAITSSLVHSPMARAKPRSSPWPRPCGSQSMTTASTSRSSIRALSQLR